MGAPQVSFATHGLLLRIMLETNFLELIIHTLAGKFAPLMRWATS